VGSQTDQLRSLCVARHVDFSSSDVGTVNTCMILPYDCTVCSRRLHLFGVSAVVVSSFQVSPSAGAIIPTARPSPSQSGARPCVGGGGNLWVQRVLSLPVIRDGAFRAGGNGLVAEYVASSRSERMRQPANSSTPKIVKVAFSGCVLQGRS
jgi:hypothetical protein